MPPSDTQAEPYARSFGNVRPWHVREVLPEVARAKRVMAMIAFLWMVNLIDLGLTVLASKGDDFEELNPLARSLLGDVSYLVLFKVLMVSFATSVFFLTRFRRSTELACFAMTGVFAGLAIIWMIYFVPTF